MLWHPTQDVASGPEERLKLSGTERRAVAADPLRESAQRALMQALAAGGNDAAALLTYRELRVLLHRELNAEPDPETQALFQQIRAEAREKAALAAGLRAPGKGGGLPPGERVAAVLTQRPAPSAHSGSEATLTFLFTDIEGSSQPWDRHPEAMRHSLARHDALLRNAIEAHGGQVFKTIRNQFCAAFATAPDALAAALAGQRALHAEPWPLPAPLRARMALYTGTAEAREGDYFGAPLNRVARLLAAAHGSQILLALTTTELARDQLPEGADLRDLGERRLQDRIRPERVSQLVVPDLPAEFPPLRLLEAFSHNLPLQLTRLIGREQQIAEVQQLLATHRLLTLTGAGGSGKTRLALQVAAERLQAYPEGVWFVDLAPLANAALVPQTVADALQVREEPGRLPVETLVEHLEPRQLLLVLDNCEHLVSDCAQLAARLLQRCPHLVILATSREPLGIVGEVPYRVPSLSLPDVRQIPSLERLTQYEAVRLFVERARTVLPTFEITNENAPTVARICHRLEGIPLAIELAAARVRALPVARIDERLDDCFRLLTGGSSTALPRHQTLRALIDWSYELLSEPEQVLLQRLSVFAGGWTLEAAEAVCGDDERPTTNDQQVASCMGRWSFVVRRDNVLDLLTRLADRSLVLYEPREERYHMLETIRQYGRERLEENGEAQEVRKRHRDWSLALSEQAEPHLEGGPTQVAWVHGLAQEHDNLRAALQWAVESDAEVALRMVGALWWFWYLQGDYSEGPFWLEGALAKGSEAAPAVRAKAAAAAAFLAFFPGDAARAIVLAEEALGLAREAGDGKWIARSLLLTGILAMDHGEYERAETMLAEALPLAREARDRWAVTQLLLYLGLTEVALGNDERSRRLLEEALGLARDAEDKPNIVWSLYYLAGLALLRSEPASAGCLVKESLALSQELGHRHAEGHAMEMLGRVRLAEGEAEEARTLFGHRLSLHDEAELSSCRPHSLEGFAHLALTEAQPQRAARLLGVASALMIPLQGYVLWPVERAFYDRTLEAVRGRLSEEAFAAAWAAGGEMSPHEAVAFALENDVSSERANEREADISS
jgi:predicted ATPase/class 3 adenylate cyclase